MCGRFANHVAAMRDWADILGEWPANVTLGYNITPSQTIPIFTASGGLVARWGLIPSWSNKASNKYATFNARIESITEKPTFRGAWGSRQRCLIPALGYCEWKTEHGTNQPYFVVAVDKSPLVFAGL